MLRSQSVVSGHIVLQTTESTRRVPIGLVLGDPRVDITRVVSALTRTVIAIVAPLVATLIITTRALEADVPGLAPGFSLTRLQDQVRRSLPPSCFVFTPVEHV